MKHLLLILSVLLVCLWPVVGGSAPSAGNYGGGGQPQYDVIVDLAHPGELGADNICDAFATAVRPCMGDGWSANHSVLVYGLGDLDDEDFYDSGVHRRCWALGSTTSFDDSGDDADHALFDLIGTAGGRCSIHFDNASVDYDMTGQVEPSIFMMLGNGYETGFTSITSSSYTMNTGLNEWTTITGTVNLRNVGPIVEDGWENGQYPVAPPYHLDNADCSALDTPYGCCTGVGTGTCPGSDTTFIGMMLTAGPVDWSNFTFNHRGHATIDEDDIGAVFPYNNGVLAGTTNISNNGTGAVFYSSYHGNLPQGRIHDNSYNLFFGDTVNGGDAVVAEGCNLSSVDPLYCTGEGGAEDFSRNCATTSITWPDSLLVEGASITDVAIVDANNLSWDQHNIEIDGANTGYGIIFGAGVSSLGNYEPCCVDADIDGGTCEVVAGSTAERITMGQGKSFNGKTSTKGFACVGPGAKYGTSFTSGIANIDLREVDFYNSKPVVSPGGGEPDNAPIFSFHPDANVRVILPEAKWKYDVNAATDILQIPPDYDNIQFDRTVRQNWAGSSAALAVSNWGANTCLVTGHGVIGAPQANCHLTTGLGGSPHCRGYFPNEVYIHDCEVSLHGATAQYDQGNAADYVSYQLQYVDILDDVIYDIGPPFIVYDDSNAATCAQGDNCAKDAGVYQWQIRERARQSDADWDVTQGWLQVRLGAYSDNGGVATAPYYIQVNCDMVAPTPYVP